MSKKLIYLIFFISMLGLAEGQAQDGYRLQPISGADGVFQTVIVDGVTVYRSFATRDSYDPYMYFRCSEEIPQQTVYLEVTYKDIGYGILGVEYNSMTTNYQIAETGYENYVLGTGRERTAVFELTNADFRNAQNLGSDLRLFCEVTFQMNIVSAYVYLEPTRLFLENEGTLSLSHKAVKFDAPGDFLEVPHSATIAPSEFTIEFWFKVHRLGDPLAASGEQTLLDKRGGHGWSDGYNIRLAGTQFPIGVHAIALPGAVWTGGVESNIWYHLAAVQDSESLKMYFNGLLAHSAENQYAANTRSHLRIGEFLGYPDAAYLGLRGSIDELRIWNHPRSQNEIAAAMHEKLSGNEQGLAAYWDFDELVDGAVADLSPNSNDAILHGQASLIPSEVGMSPPPPILSEALDTDLSFTTGGDADWFSQTTTSYYDVDAAQSGDISHNQESWMQTTVRGAGTVAFYWKVSSEAGYDFLEFYIDGSLLEEVSGSVDDWEQKSYTISTLGSHTLEWRYVKDKGTDSGSDCGWVDKLEWVPTPPPAPLPLAFNPEPADGAKYVNPNVELNWSPGDGAQLHIVYFGDNFDDINTDAGGFLQETTTYIPGSLEFDKVYYWRVNEFDGVVIHKGDIWSFRTLPEIDPNLIGWWKFDERSGNIAYDSSGHDNHGSLRGDPQLVAGKIGRALEFDGSGDWLDCGEDPSLQITDAVTVAAWIKVGTQGIDHKIGGNQDNANGGYKMTVYSNNRVEFEIRTASNRAVLNRNVSGGTEIMVDVWYHLTGVYSLEGGYIRTYVNGVLDREMSTTDTLGASPGSFKIGCEPFTTGLYNFDGVMDDLRIYNQALTEAEILGVMEGSAVYLYALSPNPADGALNPNRWVNLSWSPGWTAVSHDVYFGDNFDDVEAGTEDTFQGNQTETVFAVGVAGSPYPDGLVPVTTYYWRIDEVEADGVTIHKGDVWSFSTAPDIPTPPKGRGCFLADTPVWVNGALVQISNVVSGQMVGELHCGPATECLEQIETVEEHEGTFECRDIVLESGNRISVVDAHCFMLDSGQWIAAQDLRSGLRLKTLSGTVGIKSVSTRATPFVGKVYNLKVTGVDRYLVSEDGVIVRDY